MRRSILFAAILLLVAACLPSGSGGAVAPVRPEPIPSGPPAQVQPEEGLANKPTCVVAGTVYCSEYGSRYNTPLLIVLKDGSDKYSASVSDTNGSFAVVIPCGGSFDASLEFGDKAMPVGHIDIPASAEGTVFTFEVHHTGSYLELVRDIREGVMEDDITFKLTVPGKRD